VETAKHYNYFRDYDPSLGRYVESDPLGLKAGTNTYAYVRARPLVRVDRKGLFEFEPTCFDCKNDLEAWRRQIDNSCKRVTANISDPELRECITKRCESGKIRCGGPDCSAPSTKGYNLGIGKEWRDEKIYLCPNNFLNFKWDTTVGCAAIHEWAHSCKWDHYEGLGVPGNSGTLEGTECGNWK
jgi:hypothetical protein